ncbi:MAG: tetratricopeptide repeat protein [Desulfobulbales bacterium]|nr:tetratricopeptide repeat protein [Desulfobulbales bacterium]
MTFNTPGPSFPHVFSGNLEVEAEFHIEPQKKMKIIISILLLIFFYQPVFGRGNPPEVPIDHLALATLMIHDGRYDKALEELSQVDRSSETFDQARYYTTKGVLDSKTQNYQSAIENYNKAIEATEAKMFTASETHREKKYLFTIGRSEIEKAAGAPEFDGEKVKKEKLEKLFIHLSQAYYKVGDYANTAESLDQAGDRGRDRAELFTLRAECYWKIKDPHGAIAALNRGLELFPEDTALLKQKFYYFAELKLYQGAIENAEKYMAAVEADEDDYVILAQLFRGSKQPAKAIAILERAKANFPDNAKIKMLLGHAYLEKDMYYTTAYLFKLGAYNDKKYLKDAVEMHRRVKDYPHAIFLNAQMGDKVEKLKQKIAIHLDLGEFAQVIGLKDDLERYDILNDDNVRYALAYAYYMAKDYESAEHHLQRINDEDLFLKGTVIRGNIEKCRNDFMECL